MSQIIGKKYRNHNGIDLQYTNKGNLPSQYVEKENFICFFLGHLSYRHHGMSPVKVLLIQSISQRPDAPQKLLKGNFQLIYFNKLTQHLTLFTTPFSQYPLFYSSINGELYFSNHLPTLLLKLPHRAGLNNRRIQQFLCEDLEPSNQTAYEGVSRISSDYLLTFHNGRTQLIPNNISYIKKKHIGSKEEANHVLRRTLTDSLTKLVETSSGRLASHLSAGLDSSTISALACQTLLDKPLLTFSAVPDRYSKEITYSNHTLNELPRIKALHKKYPEIEPRILFASQVQFKLCDITKIADSSTGFPDFRPTNSTWLNDFVSQSIELGVGLMLRATSGNWTASWDGRRHYLFRHVRKAMSTLRKSAYTPCNPLGSYLIKNFKPLSTDIKIHPGQEQAYLLERYRLQIENDYHSSNGYAFINNIDCVDVMSMYDVIETCLTIPDHFYIQNGISRGLIRNAMKGILPDSIRLATPRGPQGCGWYEQLQQSSKHYLGLIKDFRDIDVINKNIHLDRIENLLLKMDHGIDIRKHRPCSLEEIRYILTGTLHKAEWVRLHYVD